MGCRLGTFSQIPKVDQATWFTNYRRALRTSVQQYHVHMTYCFIAGKSGHRPALFSRR